MTNYVVTGKYVTVKTMTMEGPRIVGLFAGAPVPRDVTDAQLKHLESHDLIVAVEDAAAVNADVTPVEALDGVTAADRVREQEAANVRHLAGVKAAETRAANEAAADKAAKAKADQAKADAAVGAPDVVDPKVARAVGAKPAPVSKPPVK